MMGFLQLNYLEQEVCSRKKDKMGRLAFGRCMVWRSIEFFCCDNRKLYYSIDVCDTVIPWTLGLGRSLGVKSKYQSWLFPSGFSW
jgi:hypothetical protein